MGIAARRSFFKVGAAGVLGMASTVTWVAPASAAAPSPAVRFVLMATELRRTSARPNQLLGSISVPPFTGDRCIVAGLTTSGRGELGSFHADVVRLRDQGPVPNRGIAATFEQHVFTLAEGTLVGSGTSDDGGDGTFAVVGGTGAYATMRGSYTAEQQRSDMGGDGQARFVFCLSK